ncbi:MAG: transcriptional regulator [Acidimicrobiales bacterium]
MPHRSDPRLLVLHGLRLKGVADVDTVAAAVRLPGDLVGRLLRQLADEGLAAEHQGLLTGWSLTPTGRAAHARALRDELRAVGARPTVESEYRRFLALNPGVLDACSRWQVRDLRGQTVRNDHADPRYDDRVLGDLGSALSDVRPVGERLAATLDRFGPYTPQLAEALHRAKAGEVDFVTKPMIPSFHTVWFEMHEDLLVTLGLDRSSDGSTPGAT